MKETGNLYDFKLENQGLKYILEDKPKGFKDRIENGIFKIKAEYYEELEKIGAIIKNYKSEKDNYEEYEFPIVDTENSKLKSNITKDEYEILNAIWNLYTIQFKDKTRTLCDADLLFSELQANLQNGTPVVLNVGSHAVNAISLIQDLKDPNKYKIAIYDNNHPGEIRYINMTRYKQNKFQLDFTAWTNEYGYKCTYDKGYGVEESIRLEIHYPQTEEINSAYATLYDDGTLVISELDEIVEGKTVLKRYGKIGTDIPWKAEYYKITTVSIVGKPKPKTTSSWFRGAQRLQRIDNLGNLDTSDVTDMSNMFNGCRSLTSLDLTGFDTSNVTNMSNMFYFCDNLTSLDLSSFNTNNVTDMSEMFLSCHDLTSLDLSSFNTSNVTDMNEMFHACKSLTSLDLSSFNTSNVRDMGEMFFDCGNLSLLDLSSFNTSNVINMNTMFTNCSSLTSLNLNNFDTSNVINMNSMFTNCWGLTSLNLSSFDTSNVTQMAEMFDNCESLTSLNLSSFDTSNVVNMRNMFADCENLDSLDLRNFDTSSATDMRGMFGNCTNLITIYAGSNWNTNNANTQNMFIKCGTDHVTI